MPSLRLADMTAEPQAMALGCDEIERAFSANEIVALTLAVVALNGWNRLAISMRAPVDEYVSPSHPGRTPANADATRTPPTGSERCP